MKTLNMILRLTAVLTASSTLYADVIYSNLGPGGSFSPLNGWSIGYPFGPNEVGQSEAFSFTPSGDFYLSSVDLAIGNGSPTGSSAFLVAIYNDASGVPGSILNTALGIAPLTASVDVAPTATTPVLFSGSTLLSGGSRYWIGLHPAAAQPTDLGWWWNFRTTDLQSMAWQANTPSEVLLGGSWERTLTLIEPGYQIGGVVVPEPGTATLTAFGLLCLAAIKPRLLNHN